MSSAAVSTDHQAHPQFTDADLPSLFHDADKRSVVAQRRFFRWLWAELWLLGLGALFGALSALPEQIGPVNTLLPALSVSGFHLPRFSIFEVIEVTLLAVALVMRIIRVATRPERMWYEARAVAESVKSITWRYCVGGEPFQAALSQSEAETLVRERLAHIQDDLTKYSAARTASAQTPVTPAMEALRGQPLDVRRKAYRAGRVENQLGWYEKKSRQNRGWRIQTHAILIAVEVLAVVAALLPALHIISLNFQGVMVSIAGSGAAWMQAKRYEDLEVSYKVTANELRKVARRIDQQTTEDEWSRFVENVEGSMSREHQLWAATATN